MGPGTLRPGHGILRNRVLLSLFHRGSSISAYDLGQPRVVVRAAGCDRHPVPTVLFRGERNYGPSLDLEHVIINHRGRGQRPIQKSGGADGCHRKMVMK